MNKPGSLMPETLRIDCIGDAVLAAPGYWITPEDDVFRVTSHVQSVWEDPERFGYTRKEVERLHVQAHEKFGSEGRARELILRELVTRNWIRIRRYRHRWSINISVLSPRVRRILTRFAAEMLGDGIDGIRETDPHHPVTVTLIPENSVAATYTMREIAAGALASSTPGFGTGSGTLKDTSIPYSEIRKKYPRLPPYGCRHVHESHHSTGGDSLKSPI